MVEQVAIRLLGALHICLATLPVIAQAGSQGELIRNGSFEDLKRCPKGWTKAGQSLRHLEFWTQPTMGTADVLNRCSKNFQSSVPNNYFGHQEPFEGAGYIGLGADKLGWREYLSQEFVHPLSKDSVYLIELWVSLADNSKWTCDSVGIGFTAMAPISHTSSAIQCDTLLLPCCAIKDTINWTRLQFRYKARGTETHIVIGCFAQSNKNFVRTRTKRKPVRDHAYYYVDSISVRRTSARDQL